MGRQAAVVLYVLALVAVVVGVDVLFFRNRFWERLIVNVGIVLVFAVPEASMSAAGVTRLAIAGCTEAEIATITGHSLRDVNEKARLSSRCSAARWRRKA